MLAVKEQNNIGQTIFHVLASSKVEGKIILRVIEKIINIYSLDALAATLNMPDSLGRTAIDYAVTTKKIELTRKLVEKGCNISDPRIIIDESEAAAAGSESTKISALQFLRDEGDEDAAALCDELYSKQVLHNKAMQVAELLSIVGRNGSTMLQDQEAVRSLVTQHRTSVNAQDAKGHTALYKACSIKMGESRGNKEMVELLLALNADPNLPDHNGKTPLHVLANLRDASYKGCIDEIMGVAKLLMNSKANLNMREKKYCATPLGVAVNNKEAILLVKCLVEEGADIDARHGEPGKDVSAIECLNTMLKNAEGYLSTYPHMKDTEGYTHVAEYVERAKEVLRIAEHKRLERSTMPASEENPQQHEASAAAVDTEATAAVLIGDDLF